MRADSNKHNYHNIKIYKESYEQNMKPNLFHTIRFQEQQHVFSHHPRMFRNACSLQCWFTHCSHLCSTCVISLFLFALGTGNIKKNSCCKALASGRCAGNLPRIDTPKCTYRVAGLLGKSVAIYTGMLGKICGCIVCKITCENTICKQFYVQKSYVKNPM